MAALDKCGFQSLTHPPHGLNLPSSDYYVFLNLKKEIHGKKFRDDQVEAAMLAHFENKERKYVFDGIEKLISIIIDSQ